MEMKEEEYWKQFENSGRIEDYLSFVSSTRQEVPGGRGTVKEDEHAGIYLGDRNRIETVSGGRV